VAVDQQNLDGFVAQPADHLQAAEPGADNDHAGTVGRRWFARVAVK
jgi:hypothetical protein